MDVLSVTMLRIVSSVKRDGHVVTRRCREESVVPQAAFGRCQRMVVVRQSGEWAQVFAGGSKVVEETGRNRPREKGEKGVNFLSVKTPLEREKRRCLLLVILGEKMERVGQRALSGAEISIDPKDGRSATILNSTPFLHSISQRGSSSLYPLSASMMVKRRKKERVREKRREAFRPFLQELYVRTQASIYNVPLARVVSKKSITQQHTRESCSRSPHGPPNLARSPFFPTTKAVPSTHALSPGVHLFWSATPCVSHIYFILPAPCTTIPRPRDGILYQAALPTQNVPSIVSTVRALD